MKEVVVDTNVLVSALLTPHGSPRSILNKVALGEIELVISARLLLEVVSVFSRPRFRALIPEGKIADLVSLLHQSARIVKPLVAIKACRDPKDNAVLECAWAGKASAIVTGDNDLLELNPFRGIPIQTPKSFLDSLKPR